MGCCGGGGGGIVCVMDLLEDLGLVHCKILSRIL